MNHSYLDFPFNLVGPLPMLRNSSFLKEKLKSQQRYQVKFYLEPFARMSSKFWL